MTQYKNKVFSLEKDSNDIFTLLVRTLKIFILIMFFPTTRYMFKRMLEIILFQFLGNAIIHNLIVFFIIILPERLPVIVSFFQTWLPLFKTKFLLTFQKIFSIMSIDEK